MNREEALLSAHYAFWLRMKRTAGLNRDLTLEEKEAIDDAVDAYMESLAEQETLLYLDVRSTPVSEVLRR